MAFATQREFEVPGNEVYGKVVFVVVNIQVLASSPGDAIMVGEFGLGWEEVEVGHFMPRTMGLGRVGQLFFNVFGVFVVPSQTSLFYYFSPIKTQLQPYWIALLSSLVSYGLFFFHNVHEPFPFVPFPFMLHTMLFVYLEPSKHKLRLWSCFVYLTP